MKTELLFRLTSQTNVSHKDCGARGNMGRPSLLNDELIDNFCDGLYASGSIESAITKSGIGRSTYYRWMTEVVLVVGRKNGNLTCVCLLPERFDRNTVSE